MSVQVEGLHKRFTEKGRPAVHDVSFTAANNGITTLLGPSGSGKTTVLRLLVGLETPDKGIVKLNGADATKVPVQQRGVGVVFQGYALFKHLTVRKNVEFGLNLLPNLKPSERDERVREMLSLVQLSELSERYPEQLSGGQQQRVAFARALATRPKVLLLDEPFGALDARVRLELREWLRALHQKTHVTTLLVTHDQEEALEVSQQLVVMNEGRVEQIGSPQEIYDHPKTPFVAEFMGAQRLGGGGYVRPRDVKLALGGDTAPGVTLGQLEALSRVGGIVKAGLRLPDGQKVAVELDRSEFDALRVSIGDRVRVDLGAAKLFTEDYSI
jgi:sulfate/thiosulfate transport system ATP-binding protein